MHADLAAQRSRGHAKILYRAVLAGTRRARAAALLSLSLPGAAYIYQGEELGLWEVEDIPAGPDGAEGPDASGATWLPQPASWKGLTVEAELAGPGSMLSLYRHALRVRHSEPAFAVDGFTWLPGPEQVLCYRRGADVTVVINASARPVELPAHEAILAASGEVPGGVLPPDTSVWLRTRPPAC